MRLAPSALPALLALAVPAAAQQSSAILDAPLVVVDPTRRLDHLLDWNGDGLMDFVGLRRSTNSTGFEIYLNDGQGGLRGILVLSRGAGGPQDRFETCDLDGDQRQDLLWVESSSAGFLNVFGSTSAPQGLDR